jgi:hypothetical protein
VHVQQQLEVGLTFAVHVALRASGCHQRIDRIDHQFLIGCTEYLTGLLMRVQHGTQRQR